jgi:2-oxoisovalerate dehydrogenase E2 component (dihydrolipoyl transacylase)
MSTFRLPDLGEGLADAEIREWHVKVGDRVAVDQPMVSVETAKAVVEVPVPFSGTVTALHAAVGDIVATGAPLIDFDSGTVVGTLPAPAEEDLFEPLTAASVAGRADSRSRAIPVARALATRLGLDLTAIAGSGPGGVVNLDDVIRHANLGTSNAPQRVAPSNAEPLRGARRAMAQSMAASRDQVAASTVCDDADIDGWSLRGDVMPRLVRAMAVACVAEPALNAWYDAATNSRSLLTHIHLAIAVDTPSGLIVPVLRDVQDKTLDELRAAIAAHKEAAHRRSAAAEELRNFTLSLSNFGTLAGRYATPLVVPPAVAILGAGKIRREAVVVADAGAAQAGAAHAVVARRRLPLSLSFDHRCVTGGEACRFLAAVIADLEKSA